MKKRMRRPRAIYSEDLGRHICLAVSNSRVSLKRLVEADRSLPSETTIYTWRKSDPDFDKDFLAAVAARGDAFSDACADAIAACRERVRADFAEGGSDARHKANAEIAMMKVEVANLERQAGRLAPRKTAANNDDDDGGPWRGDKDMHFDDIDELCTI